MDLYWALKKRMLLRKSNLPKLLFIALGITISAEFLLMNPQLSQNLQDSIKPKTEDKHVAVPQKPKFSEKSIRLTAKSAPYILKTNGIGWAEKQLKKAGIKKSSTGDVLYVFQKQENGKTQTTEAYYYSVFGSFYVLSQENKTVVKKQIERTDLRIKESIKKSFYHTVSPYKMPHDFSTECVKSLNLVTNTQKHLKPGAVVDILYSTVRLPNGAYIYPKLKFISLTHNKTKHEVYIYKSDNTVGYYNSKGELIVPDKLSKPIRGRTRISSPFGYRIHPILRYRKFHKGVDYAAPRGMPVYASSSGRVTFSGRQQGYGNLVEVEHRNGIKTRYAHLHKINVQKSQTVGNDTVIGTVGSTGRATAPHLHHEVIKNGKHVNPTTFCSLGNYKLTGAKLKGFKSYQSSCSSQIASLTPIKASELIC